MSSATGTPPVSLPTGDESGLYANNSTNDYARYIYVLVAVVLGILAVSYWLLVRRRKRSLATLRANGLLTGPHAGMAVWVPIYRSRRPEEGLDELGEAPPPYVPGQPAPNLPLDGNGQAVPMQEFEGKPPNYMEHPSLEDESDLMRPPATHRPTDRNDTTRLSGGGGERSHA